MGPMEVDSNGVVSPADVPFDVSFDAKGRQSISSMSDTEKIDELLATARALQDLIDSMMGDAMDGKGPAGKVLKMMSAFL